MIAASCKFIYSGMLFSFSFPFPIVQTLLRSFNFVLRRLFWFDNKKVWLITKTKLSTMGSNTSFLHPLLLFLNKLTSKYLRFSYILFYDNDIKGYCFKSS